MMILNFLHFPTICTILQSNMMSIWPFINGVFTSAVHRPFMWTRCRSSVCDVAPCFMYSRWRLTKRESHQHSGTIISHNGSGTFLLLLPQTDSREKVWIKKKKHKSCCVVAQVCSAVWHFSPTQEPKPSTTSSSLSLAFTVDNARERDLKVRFVQCGMNTTD